MYRYLHDLQNFTFPAAVVR